MPFPSKTTYFNASYCLVPLVSALFYLICSTIPPMHSENDQYTTMRLFHQLTAGRVHEEHSLTNERSAKKMPATMTFRAFYVTNIASAHQSSARASTNIISAGKRESRRHSATSFSENVVVAKRSYRIVRSFIILRSGESLTSFNRNNRANFSGEKKSAMKLSGESIFLEYAKKLKVKYRPCSRPHPRI